MRRDTLLSQTNDDWYVRLPDGKVLHAPTTGTVRKNIKRGRIPTGSTVRRSEEDEWVTLAWTSEFADIVKRADATPVPLNKVARRRRTSVSGSNGKAGGTSTRLDPREMHTVGIRAFFPELLAALENTVVRRKLMPIALSALLLGALFALSQYAVSDVGAARLWFNGVLAALAGLVLAASSAHLTRTTFVELSQLRPARPTEVQPGWLRRTLRLFIAQLLTAGVGIGLVFLLRALPHWLLPSQETPNADQWLAAASLAAATAAVGSVILWPVILLTLLLAPVFVVEESLVITGLKNWYKLLRQHLGSVIVYELLATTIGLALALVVALPLLVLVPSYDDRISFAGGMVRSVLLGLPAAFLFAYLTVANVFIYLNLRYETPGVQSAVGSRQ
jgi:hypothetical protein